MILMHACDILDAAGVRFHEASNGGDDAIEVLARVAQSLVLLFSDVEMASGTSGFALARHVAEHWTLSRS